ncbi:MAG: SDR family NAD(P)-dependent oxidoreductase, partial [Chloroflexota bacterium]
MSEASKKQPTREALLDAAKQSAFVIKKLQKDLAQFNEPIAVIGMGCRFPGGVSTPEQLWQLLHDRVDAITEIPADRWDVEAYYDPDPEASGKMYTRSGGFLEQIDSFDPSFFGLSPRETISLDPQQRLLLEVSWEAIERAGIVPAHLLDSRTGVFVGICSSDYLSLLDGSPVKDETYLATGNLPSVAAGRLAYTLGLTGPCLAIDTACSSSLVSVHQACRSLQLGECDMALAGGVNLILRPEGNIAFSKAHLLSPDGRCKTFDASANGYVRGEGCGVLLLKRLSQAQQDGDPIVAVLRGSMINQDGHSSSLTAPNGPSQETVIRQALQQAGISPNEVGYIEAHGTGTALGDPIEISALNAIFAERDEPLWVGSIKTNVGHLEGAAGIAGLIKAILTVQHQQIPPNLHFEQPNPYIDWVDSPVQIPTEVMPWSAKRPVAGVSSFGFSGTNAHIVLEAAPQRPAIDPDELIATAQLMLLSAKTRSGLIDLVQQYSTWFDQNPDVTWTDVAYTSQVGRTHFSHRLAVMAASLPEVAQKLIGWQTGDDVVDVWVSEASDTLHSSNSVSAKMPLEALAEEYVQGVTIDWGMLHQGQRRRKLVLPTYPFQRKRYWLEAGAPPLERLRPLIDSMTRSPLVDETIFETTVNLTTWPTLADHLVYGTIVSPGAYQLAMVLNAADLAFENSSYQLEDIVLPEALLLPPQAERSMQLIFDLSQRSAEIADRKFELISLPDTPQATKPATHATGHLVGQVTSTAITAPLEQWQQQCKTSVSVEDFYNALEPQPIDLGPSLRWLKQLWAGEGHILGCLTLPTTGADLNGYVIHPGLLDACFQVAGVTYYQADTLAPYLPFAIDTLHVYKNDHTQGDWWCYVEQKGTDRWNIHLTDSQGVVILEIKGLRSRLVTPEMMAKRLPWAEWLYGVEWQPRAQFGMPPDYLPTPKHLSDALAPSIEKQFAQSNINDYQAAVKALNRLSLVYIVAAFEEAGFPFEPGEVWSIAQISQKIGLIPKFERLLERLLSILAEAGIFQQSEVGWQVLEMPETPDLPQQLRQTQEIFGDIVSHELALLTRCAEKLSAVWQGKQDPLDLLFPGGDTGLVTQLYQGSQSAQLMNRVVEQVITNAVNQIPATQGVRILEIGAGTGSTTRWLLPHCPAAQCDYYFTDLGTAFLPKAQAAFADYPFVQYQTLDIEQSPASQGFGQQTFDIVIAANVIHATQDLRETLTHIRHLLSPNGLFVLWEGTTPQPWTDLIFGLTEGWWRYSDERQGHPLRTSAQWQALLLETGFQAVVELPAQALMPELEQSILVAQASEESLPTSENWLLFADQSALLTQFSKALRQRGYQPIIVQAGDTYQKIDEQTFVIRADDPTDYQQLFADAPEIKQVVHLWGINTPELETLDELDAVTRRHSGTLLSLVQVLLKQSDQARLSIVTQNAQVVEDTDPVTGLFSATLWGLGRVIALEHPDLNCIRIDLDITASPPVQAKQLLAELSWQSPFQPSEDQIAVRHGQQYVARLAPQAIDHSLPNIGSVVRANVTYLITGGLGGLGLGVARWLIEQGATHLLLVGRHQPNSETQTQLDRLTGPGATITTAPVDVSDKDQLADLLAQIPAETPLAGIIHAAGLLADGLLHQQNWDQFTAVMKPKIWGSWYLHQLTQHQPLDFFVLFASGVGLLGQVGQANHAAANTFLDALAHYRQQLGLPALTIDWGVWDNIGATQKLTMADRQRLEAYGQQVINVEQGFTIFEQLLAQAMMQPDHLSQIGVLPINRAQLATTAQADWPFLKALIPEQTGYRPQQVSGGGELFQRLAASPVEDRQPLLTQHLQTMVANSLGLPTHQSLDTRQGLMELGLDSLMAIEIKNKLERNLDQSLSATLLFDYPTIEALAAYLLDTLVFPSSPAADVQVSKPLSSTVDSPITANGRNKQRDQAGQVISEITSLSTNVAQEPFDGDEPIAIIGMGCRFPGGADSPEKFWQLLCDGIDAIGEVPPERWNMADYYDPDPDVPGKMQSRYGGFLADIDQFDAQFFNLSRREAVNLDPQQRLLLEVSWEALEAAGIAPERLFNSQTGVFVGICTNDYQSLFDQSQASFDSLYAATGNALSVAAGRLAYTLGLTGPCISVDTACSKDEMRGLER